MNKLKYISMATMAILMTACSNEDTTIADNSQGKVMTLTTTLRMADDASTRVLTDNGTKITATWEQGEEFQILYEKATGGPGADLGIAKATVASVSAGTATVTATLTDAKDGGAITFSYPYNHADPGTDHNTDQIGTLADINANFACMYGDGTMSVSGNTVSIDDGGVAMTQEISIWKFTFSDGNSDITSDITNLQLTFENTTYDVNPTSQEAIYVAIYDAFPFTTGPTTITATIASGVYTATKPSVTLEVGNMYCSSVVLSAATSAASKELSTVKPNQIGWRIGSDGKAYSPKGTLPTGVSARAMITYVGSKTGESAYNFTHGLALAMSDANGGSYCQWKTSRTDADHAKQTDKTNFTSESGLQYNSFNPDHNTDTYPAFQAAMANNGTVKPAGCSAWFLPSAYQWNQMINACKNVLGTNNNYTDLRDGFSGVGGSDLLDLYWSSTESNDVRAWDYHFEMGSWALGYKDTEKYVRSALAF